MNISRIGSSNSNYYSNSNSSKNTVDNSRKTTNHQTQRKNSMPKNNIGISSLGNSKKNSILENLMKQKENLTDSKNTLMEKASKNGNDPLSIKEKVEDINKQIQEIDKQINNLKLEDQRNALGVEDKSKNTEKTKKKLNNESHESAQKDSSMDNILDLSGSLTKSKTLSRQRNTMTGNAKVLEGEIKADERRGINPVRKKDQLAEMKDKIENITKNLVHNLNDVNTKTNNKTQSNTSNNAVNKNEAIKDISSVTEENVDKLLIKQQQAEQNIKHYIDKDSDTGEKIDIMG